MDKPRCEIFLGGFGKVEDILDDLSGLGINVFAKENILIIEINSLAKSRSIQLDLGSFFYSICS
jgi:hypothetical protein